MEAADRPALARDRWLRLLDLSLLAALITLGVLALVLAVVFSARDDNRPPTQGGVKVLYAFTDYVF